MNTEFTLSGPAEIDLLEIWTYIARDNVRAANHFTKRVIGGRAIGRLMQRPENS
ncbi:MAG TPA: hypothetical protein VH370_27510 [Humisphaera sp.]|jgi:plasmid stabilization system protein ParE|nr:hypothetical protein [Humisphaera sp.]